MTHTGYTSGRSPALVARGWSHRKATERRLAAATRLASHDLIWEAGGRDDAPAVERLVRAHIDGTPASWTLSDQSGLLVTRDRDRNIVAAAIIGIGGFTGGTVVCVQDLVVDPKWRGQGVGTVTLGVVDQFVEKLVNQTRPIVYYGGCKAEAARFYQRCGYSVLQAGEALTIPFLPSAIAVDNPHYPCAFVLGAQV